MNKPVEEGVALAVRINGEERRIAFDPRGRLSDLLRDELGLTGTKIGCHAGDCGACTVLLDGEQVCSCLVAAGQCDGREVVTVEGLASDGRLSALQQAFVEHGAAQCGICTPGMLVAATALLAACPRPSEGQVVDALGGVLCRCTGYRKIVEAVLAVAQECAAATVPASEPVGARVPRLDGVAKVTGAECFGADRFPADAAWMRTIRSPHARARFSVGDLAGFRALHPGIDAIVTAADVPNNRFAIFPELRDQPVLADGGVRFRGEAVLLLVGSREAVMAVEPATLPIEWQVLPALPECAPALAAAAADPADALHARWPDNVLCRGRVNSGDVDQVLAHLPAGAHAAGLQVITRHVEHAYIEPEAGYAVWQDSRVHIFACTQTPYLDRDEVASVMGIDPAQVRIEPSAIGGGFGGKLDVSVQPLLAVAARKVGRAVRTVWDRPESMIATTKRHPADMTATLACSADGDLLAYDFHGDFNTGAYSSWGPTVANRVPIHASGPYRVPNMRALTRAVLTNNAVAGAFRGFGVPQSTIVVEALMDELALACAIDPLEFRYRNALRAGDRTATGQRLDASVGLRACLDQLRPAWSAALARAQESNAAAVASGSPERRGVGIACMWYGIGNTVMANPSTMTIGLRRNGRFMLYNGAQEIGQGTYTIMPQIAAQALGVPLELIDQIHGDTDATEDAGKSSASRQTFVSGNAARLAGLDLRRRLAALAGFDVAGAADGDAKVVGDVKVDDAALALPSLHIAGGRLVVRGPGGGGADGVVERTLDLGRLAVDARGDVAVGRGTFNPPTVPLDADGQGVPYATYGFAAQVAELTVDTALGLVSLQHIHAAHDVGRAINPTLTEGQIHGGIAQGIGLALMEEYVSGRTDNLHDYLIPTAGDVPSITTWLVEDPEPLGPYGAKGVGEPALVATAPAILNAIRMATGVRLSDIPATPARVRAALLATAQGTTTTCAAAARPAAAAWARN